MTREPSAAEAPAGCDVAALEELLGHRFGRPELLRAALTHPSRAHEEDGGRGNERLEFLGDAVLDLVAAELLYERHPGWSEGELHRARAALVNARALARRARALGLGRFVRLGRSERDGGAEKDRVLANCLEAIVGAVYLDAGLAAARGVVRRAVAAGRDPAPERDPKTRFQEWAHAQLRQTPVYETVDDSGVEQDEARFGVEVRVGAQTWGAGRGRTKRRAERAAAQAALGRAEREGA